MLVALTALVVAKSGTAIAAGLVSGDSLVKKHSLSGNRLRNHTITGTQVNLNKLGKVPSAKNADHATTATSATSATTAKTAITASAATAAVTAANAANATDLGGQPASAYEPSGNLLRTGLVTLNSGQTTTLPTFAPFTLTLKCVPGTGSAINAELDASSTVANSIAFGTALPTAGTAAKIMSDPSTATYSDDDNNTVDFLTPTGSSYQALVSIGHDAAGAPGKCFANAVIFAS